MLLMCTVQHVLSVNLEIALPDRVASVHIAWPMDACYQYMYIVLIIRNMIKFVTVAVLVCTYYNKFRNHRRVSAGYIHYLVQGRPPTMHAAISDFLFHLTSHEVPSYWMGKCVAWWCSSHAVEAWPSVSEDATVYTQLPVQHHCVCMPLWQPEVQLQLRERRQINCKWS